MAQITAIPAADLEAVVRRNTPAGYHEPLEANSDSGWEIHKAHAAQAASVSQSLADLAVDLLIEQATGHAWATGTVAFSRAATTASDEVVKAGTRFEGKDGRRFTSTADATFPAASLGPITVAARAMDPGYHGNLIQGEAVEVALLATGSDDGEYTAAIPVDWSGGKDAALDALGANRGTHRRKGETDVDYRSRIKTVLVTTTPNAIQALLDEYTARYGAEFEWQETIDLDSPIDFYADDSYADADVDLHVDSLVTHRGAFFVLVPEIGEVVDTENYCDTNYAGNEIYCDVEDEAKAAVASGLLATLDQMSAAGIAIIVWQVNPPASLPTRYDNFTDDIQ